MSKHWSRNGASHSQHKGLLLFPLQPNELPCDIRMRSARTPVNAWRSWKHFKIYIYIYVETPVADRLQSIENPSGDPFQLQPMNVPADTTIDMLAPGRKTWLRHSWKSTRLLNYKKFEPRLLLTRLQLLRIESLLIGARHIGAGDLWSLPSGIFCCITFGDETAQII